MLCAQGFADEQKLSEHMHDEHGRSCDKPTVPAPKARRFEIPSHLNVLPSTPTSQTSFICFICPDEYYREGDWSVHQRTVHNQKCEVCGNDSLTQDQLIVHKAECKGTKSCPEKINMPQEKGECGEDKEKEEICPESVSDGLSNTQEMRNAMF